MSSRRAPSYRPGRGHRTLRRLTQLLAFVAIFTAPVLGGWQRLDRAEMSSWDSDGRNLPSWLVNELPTGDAPRQAYDAIQLAGGGEAASYVGVPMVDPLAGTLALVRAGASPRTLLALALPTLLALLAGRVFCGWFCPFGALARALDVLAKRLHLPRFQPPRKRPVRWLLLGAAVGLSLLGVHLVLYLLLPHLLLQQAVYSAWLLGGGGVVLAVFLALVLVGLAVGPTTYCATLCPTGTFLGLLGRTRVVRLRIAEPSSCGARCSLCSTSCWMGLDPASGDPGPDCDLCARCVPVCPRTNLRVGLLRGERKAPRPSKAAVLVLGALSLSTPNDARALDDVKPRLVLEASQETGDLELVISAVDMTGVKLGIDSAQRDHGTILSVFLARGERGAPDERGVLPSRETYGGPLTVVLRDSAGEPLERLEFERPTAPISTPRRSIYRRKVERRLAPGTVVEVASVSGWLPQGARFEVPVRGQRVGTPAAWYGLAGALLFAGLALIALVPPRSKKAV